MRIKKYLRINKQATMKYTDFVKKEMAKLKSSSMKQQDKMKKIGELWRHEGHETKSKKKEGKGEMLKLKGGILKRKHFGRVHKKEDDHHHVGKGSHGTIVLDSGVVLHPSMMGEGFWSDAWDGFSKGFMMPIKAIGAVAPLLRMAL